MRSHLLQGLLLALCGPLQQVRAPHSVHPLATHHSHAHATRAAPSAAPWRACPDAARTPQVPNVPARAPCRPRAARDGRAGELAAAGVPGGDGAAKTRVQRRRRQRARRRRWQRDGHRVDAAGVRHVVHAARRKRGAQHLRAALPPHVPPLPRGQPPPLHDVRAAGASPQRAGDSRLGAHMPSCRGVSLCSYICEPAVRTSARTACRTGLRSTFCRTS